MYFFTLLLYVIYFLIQGALTIYTSDTLIMIGNTKLKEKTDSYTQGALNILEEGRDTDGKNFLKGEDMFKI